MRRLPSSRTVAPILVLLPLILALGLLPACASRKTVSRIPTDSVTDLSGRWNDTDSRLVSEEMIQDCLASRWKSRHLETRTKKPVIIVGDVRNKTTEHISQDTFVGDIERSFVNSGEADIVASAEERLALRSERADQESYASEETVKKWGLEKGADYMLSGVISSITDSEKGESVIFYQVDMTLIDLENNTKVWIGQKKIKKLVSRSKASY